MIYDIEVVQVSEKNDIQKQDGSGTYNAVELIYRNSKGEIKTMKVVKADFNKQLVKDVLSLKPSQKTTLTTHMNKTGHINVKAVGEAKEEFKAAAGGNSYHSNSNDRRDASIMAMNAMNNATLLIAHGKRKDTDVGAVARVLVEDTKALIKEILSDTTTPAPKAEVKPEPVASEDEAFDVGDDDEIEL